MAIPLGGTSNHFIADRLRELGGWNPYNVTEDADLGVRIFAKGWRTNVIDSTTFEEANSRLGNWIRQRSRWVKGYMQTYLYHMRQPIRLYRAMGPRAFFAFHLFFGASIALPAAQPDLPGGDGAVVHHPPAVHPDAVPRRAALRLHRRASSPATPPSRWPR